MRRTLAPFLGVALLVLAAAAAHAADPPFQLKSADGKSSISIGFLAQPQGEWLTTPDGANTSQNLFVRRLRLMFGGKVSDRVSFFIETDSPNFGKAVADGTKIDSRVFIQDAILTFTARPELQVDAGMLLAPISHNSGQSAATLLAVEYGPYTFLQSDPLNLNCGRDYGLQARGYLARHLEYRAGVFQGRRGPQSTAPLRYLGRVVWYPLDAETGFFYSGTNLGARRVVAVGASVDHQGGYNTRGADLYIDLPVHRGDAVTGQVNFIRYDGGPAVPQLPRQRCWTLEGGYFLHAVKLEPFVQIATRNMDAAGMADERKYQAGVAYWASGHRYNVKAGIARLTRTGSRDRTQLQVQGQIFMW